MKELVVLLAWACLVTSCQTAVTLREAATLSEAKSSWLEIDAGVFEANLRTLRAELGSGGPAICAVMKADAYGNGIALLVPSVIKLDIPCVGIADNSEAAQLRAAGFKNHVLRIRAATLDEITEGLKWDIEETLGNLSLARNCSSLALHAKKNMKYHLALNSGGMSRDGIEMSTEQGRQDALEIVKQPGLALVGIMTHFAVEDRQDVLKGLKRFQEDSSWIVRVAHLDRSKLLLHGANSFTALEVPEARLDMVRPGGLLYGDTVPSHTEFKHTMTFKSVVAAVNSYPAGNTVSYDRTFQIQRNSKLANIVVGYANGYRRSFSNKAFVLIRGRRFPVLGRVTMNTIVADVTDDPEVAPGDEVVLFGRQGSKEISQPELEKISDTIFADLYTVWGRSNPRVLVPPHQ